MRDLTGTTCEALVAREFWLDDRRISHACYVFLAMDTDEALGWFFNDDSEQWQSESVAGIAIPGSGEHVVYRGQAFRYPHMDLAERFLLRGRALKRWVAQENGPIAEARLEFADGCAVVFEYDCRSEQDSIRFEATASVSQAP